MTGGKTSKDGKYRCLSYAQNKTFCPECGREMGVTRDRFRDTEATRWNEWRVVAHRRPDVNTRCLGSRNVVPDEAVFSGKESA